jgi:hypothetical protein
MRGTRAVFSGLSARFILVTLAAACALPSARVAAAPKKHSNYMSDAEKERRKLGYRTRDEVELPEMATPFMASAGEPIGSLEVPGTWAYSPGKSAAGSAAAPAGESASASNGRQSIALPKIYGGFMQAVFSTPLPKHVVMFEYGEGGAANANALYPPTFLRVFDLATGQQSGKVKLPPGFRPVALSEDGSRVLLLWRWKQLRLDVFDFVSR